MKNKLLFIVATHGDESFSIPVLKKLEENFPKDKFNYDWIVGNPKASEENKRFIDTDLNRCAPGNINSNSYEEKRASEIIELSDQYDLIIDIHGSSSEFEIVSIIPYPLLQNMFLAFCLELKNNVIWNAKSSIEKGPLVQFVKCPAVEIECGPKNDPKIQEKLYKVLSDFLIKINNDSSVGFLKNNGCDFYAVYGKIEGNHDQNIIDFEKTNINGEEFYPFLSNQYLNILCYKTIKIDFKNYYLY